MVNCPTISSGRAVRPFWDVRSCRCRGNQASGRSLRLKRASIFDIGLRAAEAPWPAIFGASHPRGKNLFKQVKACKIPMELDLTFATSPQRVASECQIQNPTGYLYLLVSLRL